MNGASEGSAFHPTGDSFLTNREFDKARTQYELAHHHDPDNPYHLRHLAECLIGAKKYDEAVASWKQAIGQAPSYPGTYRHLADAYVGKGDYDAAVEQLEKAIVLVPISCLYRRWRGVWFYVKSRAIAVRAIDMFKEAMARDETDGQTQGRYLDSRRRLIPTFMIMIRRYPDTNKL